MITWRIYYEDGSVFDDAQGAPEMAPGVGVQVIAQADPLVGRVLLHGGDALAGGYFWYHGGQWFHGDVFGLFDYLSRPGAKVVKFGRSVLDASFRAALQRTANDPDLPMKSARYPTERV